MNKRHTAFYTGTAGRPALLVDGEEVKLRKGQVVRT